MWDKLLQVILFWSNCNIIAEILLVIFYITYYLKNNITVMHY